MNKAPLAALALIALALPSMAKTPDGLTPSEEDVCDEYSGAAYGLCNAYCEAMDCDDPAVRAAETACEAVATRFTKKTGEELTCGAEPTTIDAADDYEEVDVPGTYSVFLLANDTITPDDAAVEVTLDGAPTSVDLVDASTGEIEFTWNELEEDYFAYFSYTACTVDECDTATVFLIGE